MKYLIIAAIFLTACTKTMPDQLNEANMLCVTQVKNKVSISIEFEPKDYLRILDVVCEFGEKKVSSRFFVYSGETCVTKTFEESAMLTKYYTVTLLRYHE